MKIIFFDGICPMCNWIVRWLIEADRKKIFWFSPLQGETAQKKKLPKDRDSLILFEGETLYFEARAVMRIFWLLGGKYKLIGWIFFMPSFLIDAIYRFIARHRHKFFGSRALVPLDESRLLP